MKVVLPAPLGPIRPDELTGLDPEVDVDDRADAAEADGQRMCLEDRCHSATLRAAVRDCETITRIINNMLNSRAKRCYCRLAVTANIHSWITRDGRVTNVALTHARRT